MIILRKILHSLEIFPSTLPSHSTRQVLVSLECCIWSIIRIGRDRFQGMQETPSGQKVINIGDRATSRLQPHSLSSSFTFYVKLVLKECEGLLLPEFPQVSALVFVYYINKYCAANVPIWQGREKSRKMKLQFHCPNTNEGDAGLAW